MGMVAALVCISDVQSSLPEAKYSDKFSTVHTWLMLQYSLKYIMLSSSPVHHAQPACIGCHIIIHLTKNHKN
jgi:hypothetical protein